MNSARFVVADVFDGLATLEDESIDLVVTSPPFLALRSYLPADHPDKGKEIGSESTPAEFIDTLLLVSKELRRVLAPHGSICVELGDTYAGSGGAGGDYGPEGLRAGQPKFRQMPPNTAHRLHPDGSIKTDAETRRGEGKNAPQVTPWTGGAGWPLAKSKTLIPQLYEIALAYGINPLTGTESPAGQWRIRNVVTWARPNPSPGSLADKWRPATSDVVVACVSATRYWDDLATRKPLADSPGNRYARKVSTTDNERRPDGSQAESTDNRITKDYDPSKSAGAPLLDYWEISPGGYPGSHYAVMPQAVAEPLVKAMCPEKVCRECGEPSRRIVKNAAPTGGKYVETTKGNGARVPGTGDRGGSAFPLAESVTLGFTDCGHDDYRPGIVLDPFAGSGTTLEVAVKWGRDAVGFDLDKRNADLARERVGDSLFHTLEVSR